MKDNLKNRTLDMTTGVVWKQLLLFAIPLILGDLLQQFYSTADSIIVGRFVSKQALAAVSGTETVTNIIIGIFTGLSMGVTIVLAQLFGAKEKEELHKGIQTTITIMIVGGLLFTLIGVLLVPWFLTMLATPSDVYSDAKIYLMIYFGGMLGIVAYNMCGSILRAFGNSRLPLIALVVTSICNIVFDLLFVVVFRWGVTGAAIATIGSQFASAIFLLIVLCNTDEIYHVDIQHLSFDRKIFSKFIQVGLPISIQKSLVAVSNTLIVSRINVFGSGAMAAWGVYRKVDHLILSISQNLSVAVSTFVGQNYGARQYKRIENGSKMGCFLGVGIVGILISLVVLLREPLVSLFNTELDVIAYGSRIIIYIMPFQILSMINQIQSGIVRGYGDSKGPLFVMIVSHIILRQVYLNVAWNRKPVLETAINCYPLGWACAVILLFFYINRVKKKLIEEVNIMND